VIQYIGLADYLVIAADATGVDVDEMLRIAKIDLADSALHAPAAGFGETEFYPDFISKAAVLVTRLVKNHQRLDMATHTGSRGCRAGSACNHRRSLES
jgi:hypothetical protein